MCDWYIDTAVTSERMSAWAFAIRDRAVTLAYSGTAIEARTPIIATTIISSIRVKPRAFHRIDLMAPPRRQHASATAPSPRRTPRPRGIAELNGRLSGRRPQNRHNLSEGGGKAANRRKVTRDGEARAPALEWCCP